MNNLNIRYPQMEPDMKNIIKFPAIEGLPNSAQEAIDQLAQVRRDYIDGLMPDILERLVADFDSYGISLNEKTEKEWYFLCESIQAILFKHSGVVHPFHELIEDVIGTKEDAKPRKKRTKKESKKQPKV